MLTSIVKGLLTDFLLKTKLSTCVFLLSCKHQRLSLHQIIPRMKKYHNSLQLHCHSKIQVLCLSLSPSIWSHSSSNRNPGLVRPARQRLRCLLSQLLRILWMSTRSSYLSVSLDFVTLEYQWKFAWHLLVTALPLCLADSPGVLLTGHFLASSFSPSSGPTYYSSFSLSCPASVSCFASYSTLSPDCASKIFTLSFP